MFPHPPEDEKKEKKKEKKRYAVTLIFKYIYSGVYFFRTSGVSLTNFKSVRGTHILNLLAGTCTMLCG